MLFRILKFLVELIGGTVEKAPENPYDGAFLPKHGLDPGQFPGQRFPKVGGKVSWDHHTVELNEEDLAKLPSGTLYLAPNARIYRK